MLHKSIVLAASIALSGVRAQSCVQPATSNVQCSGGGAYMPCHAYTSAAGQTFYYDCPEGTLINTSTQPSYCCQSFVSPPVTTAPPTTCYSGQYCGNQCIYNPAHEQCCPDGHTLYLTANGVQSCPGYTTPVTTPAPTTCFSGQYCGTQCIYNPAHEQCCPDGHTLYLTANGVQSCPGYSSCTEPATSNVQCAGGGEYKPCYAYTSSTGSTFYYDCSTGTLENTATRPSYCCAA